MTIKSSKALHIIGIKTRTTNKDEMQGAGKISGLWQKFFQDEIQKAISHQVNQNIFAVYHEYESDANGPYSLLLGLQVEPGTAVPEGMTLLQIPEANYSIYETERGEMPGIVVNAWMKIWNDEASQKIKRKYTYDFELYGEKAADPKSSQVEIFIAV